MVITIYGQRFKNAWFISLVLFFSLTISAFGQTPPLDMIEYQLELRIDFEHKEWWMAYNNELDGVASIHVRNVGDMSVTEIPILLNRLMEISKVVIGGKEVSLSVQQIVSLEGWSTYQVRYSLAKLHEPILPGDERILAIHYSGPIAGYTEAGMSYVREKIDSKFTIIRPETLAYPHLVYPNEKDLVHQWRGADSFDQQIKVQIPNEYVVASGFPLTRLDSAAGFRSWSFISTSASSQIILPIAKYSHLDIGSNKLYFFHEDETGAKMVAKSLITVLDLYKKWFGPLRDSSSFSVAEIPEGFGSQALLPTILQEQSAFGRPESIGELFHEVSHLWNVKDPEMNPMRWNEGLAMFLQYITIDEIEHSNRFVHEMDKNVKSLKAYFERYPNNRIIPFREYGKMGMTSQSYSTGAIFFGILSAKLGREKLLSIVGQFYQLYFQKGATPEEFTKFLISKDTSLSRIVDDWFYGSNYSTMVSNLTFEQIVSEYR